MDSQQPPFEAAIVGAGPIGIELAVAFQRAGINYVHLEGRQIGHTISWFAPGTRFFSSNERISIAGVPLHTPWQEKASREEYLAYLRGVVQQFGLRIYTYEPVVSIRREGCFVLSTAPAHGPRTWRARRVVLASGGTALPHLLHVPGEDLPHVSHYFQDPHTYFGCRLLVVGGGNSAIEAALRCHRAGARVAISYRGPDLDAKAIKYWLYPEIRGLTRSGAITPYFQTNVAAIAAGEVTLTSATGDAQRVPADFVLLLTGYDADMSLCRMAGVALGSPGEVPQFNEQTMETNVPGVYMAGTAVAGTQNHYRVFLENCHVHAQRIVAAIRGEAAPAEPPPQYDRPET